MRAGALAIALAGASSVVLAAGGDDWIVSETTSPVNYSPIVTATASSRAGSGAPMQLSIYCRGGRTELVVTGTAIVGNGAEQPASYRVNDGAPVPVGLGQPVFGSGAAFKADVVRLLLSFPDEGGLSIRIAGRDGAVIEREFPLGGLKAVKSRLAAACNWPQALPQTRN